MGVGVSNWRLAGTVSRLGQLGVVSGTGLEQVLARRLQDGDPGGHVRRALRHFPFPRLAQRLVDTFFSPDGRAADAPYKVIGMHVIEGRRVPQELCVAANFVEVFLAREGHANPVGINYLEKIQLPHLPSLYGAMLAGVAVVIVGAGIPLEFPAAIEALANHQSAGYSLRVVGASSGAKYQAMFDPAQFCEDAALPPLAMPDFVPIIASETLATVLCRKARGRIAGFVIEGPQAGGHNAPPRGPLNLSADGQPVYGQRDIVSLAAIRKLGLPFWLAGMYGTPEGLQAARAEGAAGVQVGTPFALCVESGLLPEVRREIIRGVLAGNGRVFTDPLASPTGFPFKVARVMQTLSESDVYGGRNRVCDLGFLREFYLREDGTVGYRCAAEPEGSFIAKGGKAADSIGRKCLCNSLLANIGLGQRLGGGRVEPCLITMGDALPTIARLCTVDKPDFTAADVIRFIAS